MIQCVLVIKIPNFKNSAQFAEYLLLEVFCGDFLLFIQNGCSDNDLSDNVRVTVGSRTPILQVSLALGRAVSWDSDTGSSVGDPARELVYAGGLVQSSKTPFVVFAPRWIVSSNVHIVALAQFFNRCLNDLDATVLSHGESAVVGVAAGPVPVARNGLGVQTDNYALVLGHLLEDEPGHPQVISHLDSFTRANLELPLRWHDFSIGSTDLHTCVQAGAQMGLHYLPPINLCISHSAVVWALWSWKSTLGPLERESSVVHQSVFLFNSKPWFLLFRLLHHLIAGMSVIELIGCPVKLIDFTQDKDVGVSSEWVPEHCAWLQPTIAVSTFRLVCTTSVKVPIRAILWRFGLVVQDSRLAPQVLPSAVNPDISGDHLVLLGLSLPVALEGILNH